MSLSNTTNQIKHGGYSYNYHEGFGYIPVASLLNLDVWLINAVDVIQLLWL